MEKRGQIFLEFLFTYGWAILAVLVSLGALAYFGVIKTDRFIPEFCVTEAGISCDDFVVYDSGQIFLQTTNYLGKEMRNVYAFLTDKYGNICELLGVSLIKPGQQVTFSSNPDDLDCYFEAGEFVELDLEIDYETLTLNNENIERSIQGSLVAEVKVLPETICGDGICELTETCDSCSDDCGICSDGGDGPACGNNIKETGEVCDGSDLDGETCESLGYGAGILLCSADCAGFDTFQCNPATPCGNGVVEFGEVCDDGNNLSCDGCRADCSREDNICGDTIKECGEKCDSNSATCTTGDGYSGVSLCNDLCTGYDSCLSPNFCGDGTCNGPETCSSCSPDCGECDGGDGTGSFLPGTQIMMSDGTTKSIEFIKPGEFVISYDESVGLITSEEVEAAFSHSMPGYYTINNELKITETNPIWSNNKWTYSGKLSVGDTLMRYDITEVGISSIVYIEGEVNVYNLRVKNTRTYFAEGILVHNKDEDATPPGP